MLIYCCCFSFAPENGVINHQSALEPNRTFPFGRAAELWELAMFCFGAREIQNKRLVWGEGKLLRSGCCAVYIFGMKIYSF